MSAEKPEPGDWFEYGDGSYGIVSSLPDEGNQNVRMLFVNNDEDKEFFWEYHDHTPLDWLREEWEFVGNVLPNLEKIHEAIKKGNT